VHYHETAELALTRLTADHPDRRRAEVLVAHAEHALEPTPERAAALGAGLERLGVARIGATRSDFTADSVHSSRPSDRRTSSAATAELLFAVLDH
jgi:hypothetical protein